MSDCRRGKEGRVGEGGERGGGAWGGASTSGFGSEQDAVSVCKLLVQVAGGVAGPGNAGHLQHSTAAQLVQHQAGVKGGRHLSCIGLHTPHKVQLSPAIGTACQHWS